jgi:hypothetical protein
MKAQTFSPSPRGTSGEGPGGGALRPRDTRGFGRRETLVRRSIAILPGPPFTDRDQVDDLHPPPSAPDAPIPASPKKTAIPSPRRQQPLCQGSLASCSFHPVRLRPSRPHSLSPSNLPQGVVGEVRASASGGGARPGPAAPTIDRFPRHPVRKTTPWKGGVWRHPLSRASWRDRSAPRTAGWGRRPSRPSAPSPGRPPGPAPRAGGRRATAPPP